MSKKTISKRAEVYRPRHPERTVLYWVLSHHFERLVAEFESLVVA